MKNLESNKIIASILLSGLIAMLCGFFTNLFYNPDYHNNKRGYQVAVVETSTKKAKEKEEPVNIVEVMKLASLEKGKSLSKNVLHAIHSIKVDLIKLDQIFGILLKLILQQNLVIHILRP